jgi:phage gp29-like protein
MPPELVDHLGRPIDFAALREEQAAAQITGVRSPISDHASAGLTPGRLAAILKEAEQGDPMRYLDLAEDMEEKDLHYLSVLGTRKRAVAQLDIKVEAASDSAHDVKLADYVRAWIARDELEDDLFDMLDAIGKGFSNSEIIWDMSERQWWPARIEHRDPRWFEFDRGDLRTPMVRTESGPVPLTPFKHIFHIHKAKSGLPIRGGLARAAAWAWMFKNYSVKDWVIFAEVYGMPLRLGKYQPGASADDIKTLRRAVASLGSDAAAVVPKSMDIEFVDGKRGGGVGGGGGEVYATLAAYLDQQISKGVLGQTATTDAIAGGHAVGKEHNLVRGDIMRADAKQLSGALNRQLVVPMIDLNHGRQPAYPRLVIGLREVTDIAGMTQALKDLVPLGLEVQMSEVRDKIGFADPDEGAVLLRSPSATPPPTGPSVHARGDCPVHSVHNAGEERTQDAVDTFIDSALEDWEPLVEGAVAGVEELFDGVTSIEEARERLAEAVRNMDAGALTETLARAGFSSRIAGQLGIDLTEEEN